jgi:hypothetical protein
MFWGPRTGAAGLAAILCVRQLGSQALLFAPQRASIGTQGTICNRYPRGMSIPPAHNRSPPCVVVMCPSPPCLLITALMQFWDLYWVAPTVDIAAASSPLTPPRSTTSNRPSHEPHGPRVRQSRGCHPYWYEPSVLALIRLRGHSTALTPPLQDHAS